MPQPDIFLSYNREDREFAQRCAEAFVQEGFDVWWDVVLRSGETYDVVTESALRNAKAVVVLWSKRSANSRWVRAEATLADRCRKLVPAMIEPCERPIMFELTQTADLSGWDGDLSDPAWQSFLGDIKDMVASDQRVAEEIPRDSPLLAARPERGLHGDSPTLAVLPFANRSGLADDEVFAFGMVEDIIDALSQTANVRVLSSSAIARYVAGGIPDLGAMAEQLGVRYILEGNSRRFGGDLRVTAQLVDAADGAILWSRKFDRPLDQLASLQEELVLQVASSLGTQVMHLELERVLQKPSDHTAWEAIMRSLACFREITDASVMRGLEEAERAVAIAPDYGPAHGMLAAVKAMVVFEVSPDAKELVKEVRDHVKTAIQLAPNHAFNLVCASEAMSFIGDPQEGLRFAERAIAINARAIEGHLARGMAKALLNRWDEAIEDYIQEITIWPNYHIEYNTLAALALAQMGAGRLNEARMTIKRSLQAKPDHGHAQLINAVLLSIEGREDEAQEEFAKIHLQGAFDSLLKAEWAFRRSFRGHPLEDQVIPIVRRLWAASLPGT